MSDKPAEEQTARVIMTDPARELAELCNALAPDLGHLGEVHLATHFKVDAWSFDFFQIIFTIIERVNLVKSIVAQLDMDDDIKDDLANHLDRIATAFSANSMRSHWSSIGGVQLGPVNVQPIKAVAGQVRQHVSYRKLADSDIENLRLEVDELIKWLKERQLNEQDFVRQAILEGLDRFQFRLSRLTWLGWGYTLESLRDVIAAYVMLERGLDVEKNPDADAVLRKVGGLVQAVYSRLQTAKGAVETGDLMLKAYGLGSLWYHGKPVIAGLLAG
ncbi:hypothetical protein [Sphingomonas faeni]|uniref:hypothetical protein n=1 Tax=Sphingomonas faeni TaxID=185950 RepID=UPI00334B4B73